MADKHHIAKFVKKLQRLLEAKKKKVFGMPEDSTSNLETAAIVIKDSDYVKKTIKQEGCIEALMSGLDKNSPQKAEYEGMIEDNKKDLENYKKYWGDTQV